MDTAKIRFRKRVDASPKEGLKQSWDEWQIVIDRKILARLGSENEARRYAKKNNIKLSN
jgi:hypothetical protein